MVSADTEKPRQGHKELLAAKALLFKPGARGLESQLDIFLL